MIQVLIEILAEVFAVKPLGQVPSEGPAFSTEKYHRLCSKIQQMNWADGKSSLIT